MGRRLGLHGHGLVDRQQWGPLEPGGPPRLTVLRIRRYHCTGCARTCRVVPRGVVPGLYYSALALGLALALWAVERTPSPTVRQRISPHRQVGAEAGRGWRSLARWTRAVAAGALLQLGRLALTGPPRVQAATIASALAGHASSTDRHRPFPARAALGAEQVA